MSLKNVARLAGPVRQFGTSQVVRSEMKYGEICPKFDAKRKLFQADNNLPVHLKGGFMDNVLYKGTMLYATLGALWTMGYLIKSSYTT